MTAYTSFEAFVIDQLNKLSGLETKRMFGAWGLYCGDFFFGILDDNKLYLKTNDFTRGVYEKYGMKPLTYQKKDKSGRKKTAQLTNYLQVPVDIIEDESQLLKWVKTALQIAQDNSDQHREN